MELTEGATKDWNEIIRDENFTHLPTTTPIPTEGDTGGMPAPCSPTNPTGSNHSSQLTATTPIPTEGDTGGIPAPCLPINPTGSTHPSTTTQGTVHSEEERPQATSEAPPAEKQKPPPRTAWGSLAKSSNANQEAAQQKGRGKKSAPAKKKCKAKSSSQDYRKAWGALFKTNTRSIRSSRVSNEVLEADASSLGLFTRKDTLSPQAARNLSAQLNAAPQYKEEILPQRGRVLNEVNVIQISQFSATQTDFSRLRGCQWLTDNIIDMFLRRHVQEVIPCTHCFTTHFMGEMLEVEDSQVLYDYEKVQNWSNHIIGGLFNLKHLFVPVNINNQH